MYNYDPFLHFSRPSESNDFDIDLFTHCVIIFVDTRFQVEKLTPGPENF